MSLSYIPPALRLLVAERAGHACEYCLIAERDTYLGCSIDHIISEKHGGLTLADNLAFACLACNWAKGSDVGSLVGEDGQFVRFFNPRTDDWSEHFELHDEFIVPLTPVGEATCRILGFNRLERREERSILIGKGRFPAEDTK
jgi:hypothetical protein